MKRNQETVVLGLSGGVDSSVAAWLLKKQGYNVIGAFMKNFSDTKNKLTGECSYLEEKRMAQKVASELKIPFFVFDFEKAYKSQVIEPMFKSYEQGKTPNPDILCNTIIKFPMFWKEARKLKADYIAMGHYAKIKKTKSGFQLYQGKDKLKDQSYFLADLSQEDLSHTLFPLGNYTKDQVRKLAKQLKLPNWNKQGTRGICFVGKVNMQSFLDKRIKHKPGKIISPEGIPLGTHPGAVFFTIGQKLGEHLHITLNKPKEHAQHRYYVAEKKGNTIIAAPESHPSLKKKIIFLKKLHLINPKEKIPHSLCARIRHLGQKYPGKLQNKNKFILQTPQQSIAPGQYLVLYHKNQLVGSAEINKVQ
ncbi:MAG: tRNA 2-thiouridine(34) synthase MnmA [archaeon]